MKKFTNFENEVKPKYESKDSLKNEIFSLIDETISVKITNEDSLDKDITIVGKEELVNKIKNLIETQQIQERISTLEYVKTNVYRNFDMNWLNEEINLQKNHLNNTMVINWQDKFFNQKVGQWQSLKEINEKYMNEYIDVMKQNGVNLIKKYEIQGVTYFEFDNDVFSIENKSILHNIEKQKDEEIKKL